MTVEVQFVYCTSALRPINKNHNVSGYRLKNMSDNYHFATYRLQCVLTTTLIYFVIAASFINYC
jgi:hypothetical protein